MALHRGICSNDKHIARAGSAAGGFSAGLNDAKHRNWHRILYGVEGECAGCIAGDYQELRALLSNQKLRALDGIAGNGAAGFGAVGKAGCIAKEGEARLR